VGIARNYREKKPAVFLHPKKEGEEDEVLPGILRGE